VGIRRHCVATTHLSIPRGFERRGPNQYQKWLTRYLLRYDKSVNTYPSVRRTRTPALLIGPANRQVSDQLAWRSKRRQIPSSTHPLSLFFLAAHRQGFRKMRCASSALWPGRNNGFTSTPARLTSNDTVFHQCGACNDALRLGRHKRCQNIDSTLFAVIPGWCPALHARQ